MIPEEDLTGDINYTFRLNEVDEALYLPADKKIRLLFGRDDVIHRFYVPRVGVKVDCIPGRVNRAGLESQVGVYYGKCTEICGAHHSHIPIKVEFIIESDFLGVVGSFLAEQVAEHKTSLSGDVEVRVGADDSFGLDDNIVGGSNGDLTRSPVVITEEEVDLFTLFYSLEEKDRN